MFEKHLKSVHKKLDISKKKPYICKADRAKLELEKSLKKPDIGDS